jgi:hypothetical protein
MHVAFDIPCANDYITKLWRQQPEAIQNHEKEGVRYIWQGEFRQRKYTRFKAGAVTCMIVQAS